MLKKNPNINFYITLFLKNKLIFFTFLVVFTFIGLIVPNYFAKSPYMEFEIIFKGFFNEKDIDKDSLYRKEILNELNNNFFNLFLTKFQDADNLKIALYQFNENNNLSKTKINFYKQHFVVKSAENPIRVIIVTDNKFPKNIIEKLITLSIDTVKINLAQKLDFFRINEINKLENNKINLYKEIKDLNKDLLTAKTLGINTYYKGLITSNQNFMLGTEVLNYKITYLKEEINELDKQIDQIKYFDFKKILSKIKLEQSFSEPKMIFKRIDSLNPLFALLLSIALGISFFISFVLIREKIKKS